MSDERVQVTISAYASQMLAVLEEARVKAAFPEAAGSVQSFLLVRGQGGMRLDEASDVLSLDGPAVVALAGLLEEQERTISGLGRDVAEAVAETRLRETEIERLRERLAKAEAPPY